MSSTLNELTTVDAIFGNILWNQIDITDGDMLCSRLERRCRRKQNPLRPNAPDHIQQDHLTVNQVKENASVRWQKLNAFCRRRGKRKEDVITPPCKLGIDAFNDEIPTNAYYTIY